ncbi:MAG: hypothetical protein IT203_00925 [Fimbriimonadaceae bacterium]|nr:hypothetical protein [Fimbriimonadaceae bacterium]
MTKAIQAGITIMSLMGECRWFLEEYVSLAIDDWTLRLEDTPGSCPEWIHTAADWR